MAGDRQPNDPTPEQIAAACELIQAGWTTEERRARWEAARGARMVSRGAVASWTVPLVNWEDTPLSELFSDCEGHGWEEIE